MIDAGTYGAPSWVDLSTPDLEAAAAFYSGLFGWRLERAQTPAGEYVVGHADGREVGGMMTPGPAEEDLPPMWTVFVFVEDIDASLGKVRASGGAVLQEPLMVPGDAQVAVVADPGGGVIALIAGGERSPAEWMSDEPGSVAWVELLTRDPESAQRFYMEVFGWRAAEEGSGSAPYWVFERDGEPVAGMMGMPPLVPGEAPTHWAVYFATEDCAATVRRAQDLGGAVVHEPMEIADGRFAVLADPTGATFDVFEHTRSST